jgi:hypothetical protein
MLLPGRRCDRNGVETRGVRLTPLTSGVIDQIRSRENIGARKTEVIMLSDPLAELRNINAKFVHNFVTSDVKSHDEIIHQRFLCIMPDGAQWDRDAYMRYWATAFNPDVLVYLDYRDELITLYGDVALVRATNKYIRRIGGTEKINMNIYTDTYLREGGKWRCIQAQLTAVAPDNWPGDDTIVRKYVRGMLQAA